VAAPRLSRTTVGEIAHPALTVSGYDASHSQPGIVHFGLGAFARAHLATYTETVLEQQGGDWRIIGVSLRSGQVAKQLGPQNGLYTCVEQSGAKTAVTESYRLISAVDQVLVAPDNPGAVLAALREHNVRVVSLTVTEKGYCHDPASGELLLEHPDIVWDLANLHAPRTAIGFLVASLAERFANNQGPFTVLSLDNLLNNGALLKRLVRSFAKRIDSQLAARIDKVEFPSTMVDRIVPATTADDRADLTKRLGFIDHGMVKAEPFSQWVIEDRFSVGRPDWNLGGALFVDDVAPFETLKLRLLNGSHSAIAYLGGLAGHEFVHEVVADPELRSFVQQLMADELANTLAAPPEISLADYQAQLLGRFDNAALGHRTAQIAMDGSQKLPPRILTPLRERIACNQPFERIALVIAAWFRFVERTLASGGVDALKDPLALELNSIVERYTDDLMARVTAYLNMRAVFGSDLAHNERLAERLRFWLGELEKTYPL